MNILTKIKTFFHEWRCQILDICPIHETNYWHYDAKKYECIECEKVKFIRKSYKYGPKTK